MSGRRRRATALVFQALEARELLSVAGLTATWVGQDLHDLVGRSSTPEPSGVQDVRIALGGLPEGREVTRAVVKGLGGGEWFFQGPAGPWAAALTKTGATSADVFFEPYQRETGRPFSVGLTFADESTGEVWLAGGLADPELRMPEATLQVAWNGQEGLDFVGPGPSVGPDGVPDFRLHLAGLASGVGVESVNVLGPPGATWRSGLNLQGNANAHFVRDKADPTRGSLYLNPDRDLAGESLSVEVVYVTGVRDEAMVVAGRTDPSQRVTVPKLPVLLGGVTAAWHGQDGTGLAGRGEVTLVLGGLPAGKTVIAAVLTNEANTTWAYQAGAAGQAVTVDPYPLALKFARTGGTSAELAFAPTRDERGSELSARLVFDDGTVAVAGLKGGSVDLTQLVTGRAETETTARPGDDLQDLVGRFGTVRLAAGTYRLSAPLVLERPVAIVGETGSVLLFEQPAEAAAWTAAIKVHEASTKLESFSIRFSGPIKWEWGVQYGPAIIGTTDNLDGRANALKVGMEFLGLDIESPPAATAWEPAPLLFRLMTAQSGRIEGNVLKGGMTELRGGPWRFARNQYVGTPAGTYADAVLAGQETWDLEVVQNDVRPEPGTGKTWRFLVLTRSGVDNMVAGNTVVGVGPRDGDGVASANAAEIILTEAYKLRFEGQPLAVSANGRVVAIPAPQGDAPRVGDVVAVLSGPTAGAWRRVVQVLDGRTIMLDEGLPDAGAAISIAPGFVNLRIEGNVVDSRGSSVAANLMLVGTQVVTQVVGNQFLGGRDAILLKATASESPVHWGWSHTPILDARVDGNRVEDAVRGVTVSVEHGQAVKSNEGRVYLTATITGNVFGWSGLFLSQGRQPEALQIGEPGAIDRDELAVGLAGNVAERSGVGIRVMIGRVNGEPMVDRMLELPTAVLAAPGNLELVWDTGSSGRDGVTADGRIRFEAVTGATGYESRLGTTGIFQPVELREGFLPAGTIEDGPVTVEVRAVGLRGVRGNVSRFSYMLDRREPESVESPRLISGSDTGISATDGVTSAQVLLFEVEAAPTVRVLLMRDGVAVDGRTGAGILVDRRIPGDGVYGYSLLVTDLAGNASESCKTIVTIDTTAPWVAPELEVARDGRILGGSEGERYEAFDEATGDYVPLEGGVVSRLGPGRTQLVVRAVDVAGNQSAGVAVALLVPGPTPALIWLGQDGADGAGRGAAGADGFEDVHLRLEGLPAGRKISTLRVEGFGGGAWGTPLTVGGPWETVVVQAAGSTTADVYLQPYQEESGRPYRLTLIYDDGTRAEVWAQGDRVDPTRRVVTLQPATASLSVQSVGEVVSAQGVGSLVPAQVKKVERSRRDITWIGRGGMIVPIVVGEKTRQSRRDQVPNHRRFRTR